MLGILRLIELCVRLYVALLVLLATVLVYALIGVVEIPLEWRRRHRDMSDADLRRYVKALEEQRKRPAPRTKPFDMAPQVICGPVLFTNGGVRMAHHASRCKCKKGQKALKESGKPAVV